MFCFFFWGGGFVRYEAALKNSARTRRQSLCSNAPVDAASVGGPGVASSAAAVAAAAAAAASAAAKGSTNPTSVSRTIKGVKGQGRIGGANNGIEA